jgi:23S rRNA (uracil1939-C5)-methyltransferase
VSPGPVVDLYAGVGLFGLSLAVGGIEDVTLVEGDVVSARDLEENARPFGSRVRVERASVEDFLRGAEPRDGVTFVVDPPRTGLSKEALAGVVRLMPGRVVYVSCDVATLARDARALVGAGYVIDHLSALDLFPNTAHVETLCALRRR